MASTSHPSAVRNNLTIFMHVRYEGIHTNDITQHADLHCCGTCTAHVFNLVIYIGETHAQGVHGISCVPIATCIYCFNSPFSMSLSRSPVHNSFTDIMPCNVRLHSYKHASITVLIVHVRLGLATLAIGFWHAELQVANCMVSMQQYMAAVYVLTSR